MNFTDSSGTTAIQPFQNKALMARFTAFDPFHDTGNNHNKKTNTSVHKQPTTLHTIESTPKPISTLDL